MTQRVIYGAIVEYTRLNRVQLNSSGNPNHMNWLRKLFTSASTEEHAITEPRKWSTHRGDDWWCNDATAEYSHGNFRIETFGRHQSPSSALELIDDARTRIADGFVDILLDNRTNAIVTSLVDRGQICVTEIQLSPKTRIARIDKVDA